jgi:glycosyltransferase involved in cell wall biosynthesis
MTWIDITDVIDFLETAPSVTGIQRAALDLTTAMCALSRNCRTCTYCEEDAVFKTASLEELLACTERSEKAQSGTNRVKRRIIKTAVSLVPKKLRNKLGLGKTPAKRKKIPIGSKADFNRGDTFLFLGAFWHNPNHVHRIEKAVFVDDMKFALMVHDLIPVNHSYWFSQELTSWWSEKLKELLRMVDHVFVNSQFTANEVRRFASDNDIPIRPITTVRLGDPTFIRASNATHLGKANGGADRQYGGLHFVLMVSSIDIRKNQKFLLPIWSRLIRELGRDLTPDLLLIGKNGNRGHEFLSLLAESTELTGKIIVLNRVRDQELAWYYQRALFTVFPSLAEGWGFPVAESLSFGKVCISSDIDSIREVGGDLVSYFAANDFRDAYKLIKGLIVNPAERARLERLIANRYQPTQWATAANVIRGALSNTETAR